MKNSQFLYAEALRDALSSAETWLDLGCGHQFLPEWIPAERRRLPVGGRRIVGLDADASALRQHGELTQRVLGTVEQLPFAAATFDLITANMVVEHVANPERLFHEVSRVLKPGGAFLIHTPNVEGYTTRLTQFVPESLRPPLARLLQGRLAEDVYPTFYRANEVSVLRKNAEAVRLRVAELQTVLSSPQLYRVPVVRSLEQGLLRRLEGAAFERWRPCIIARFVRAA